jgi:hypothetical protein
MEPLKNTEFAHFDRCQGEYPARLLGYIPDKQAVFRSLHEDVPMRSGFDNSKNRKWCEEANKISEQELEDILSSPKVVKTKPWIVKPKDWWSFLRQQERFNQGKVQFIWQIDSERFEHLIYTKGRDEVPLTYATREAAEKFFLEQCGISHGYSYSDAVANEGEEEAEIWKGKKLIIERTEMGTAVFYEPEDSDFDGYCYGWLKRRELYL